MEQTGLPITFDHMVSMPDGPVLSATLGYILGSQAGVDDSDWELWVSDNADHKVSLGQSFSETTELTKLSQTDVRLMAEVWACCKDMGLLDIKEYIRTHCSEWPHTNGHQ